MSDYLTTLPAELIHKIVENVPLVDILTSVCLVNKRLRSISLNCHRSQLDFSCVNTWMNKSQFDSICTQMIHSTSEVISLTLFDKNDPMSFVKNNIFFYRFNIIDTTFPNLRSLTLTSISYSTWRFFTSHLPPLIMTLCICLYFYDPGMCSSAENASGSLSELLFLSPSLKRLSVEMCNVSDRSLEIRSPDSSILSSVQYLRIKSVTIDLLSLLAVAPMLDTLECRFDAHTLKLVTTYPLLLYLKKLRITLGSITWNEMANLLSSFPQLVYLVINADDVNSGMADGFEWAQILQQINHFEFKFKFSSNAFRQKSFNLNSFRTKFWLQEKKWFVRYDRYLNDVSPSMLYSNSSSIGIDFPQQMNGPIISESTASEPPSFFNVDSLTINEHYLQYPFLHRYNHVKKLYLPQITASCLKTFNNFVTCVDTSHIMTCNIVFNWDRNFSVGYIEFLRSLPHLRRLEVSSVNLRYLLLHQWHHIIDLKIEDKFESASRVLSPKDIDTLCHSFPHIKQLDFHSSSVTDLVQLINKMKFILTDIIIRQSCNIKNQLFISYEWIERNTELKKFHYTFIFDSWNSIRLWL